MSFVQWVTALVLILIALCGGYASVATLLRRRVEVGSYSFDGYRAALFAPLYLVGGALAIVAALLIFFAK